MRPLRLHLHGFGIFSGPTEIDFTDVELFALTGPTGSGKTTILDGICFALYGAVPRHGEGSVAPIVNQQMNEATVMLKFSLDGATYSVARRVRRSGTGATTGEASLERDGEVLAASAGSVTAALENLLGLDFRQFTTCVLLPQGEFARFLNERPAKRQELLGALLDLGLYDIIAGLASGRGKEAEGKQTILTQRLAELSRITETDLESLRTRQKELEALSTRLGKSLANLDQLRAAATFERQSLEAVVSSHALLTSVEPPKGWKEIGRLVALFTAKKLESGTEQEAAARLYTDLSEVEHPARTQIERFLQARADHSTLAENLPALSAELAQRQAVMVATTETLVAAERAHEDEINADRAAHIRAGLKVGDPCPVCGEKITKLARGKASSRLVTQTKALEKAKSAATAAEVHLKEFATQLALAEGRLGELETELVDVDSVEVLSQQLKDIADHEVALGAARARLAAARVEVDRVGQEAVEMEARLGQVREALNSVWPQLSSLEPPLLDRAQPVEAWEEIIAWRDQRIPVLQARRAEAEKRVAAAEAETREAEEGLRADLAVAGLVSDVTGAREAVAVAQTDIATAIARVEEAHEEAGRVTQERDTALAQRDVAKKLASELAANKFKKWIFDEIFAALVAGANLRLSDLTSGQYALAVTNNDFEVIDHFAADHRRGIKSLSGGETFLVSLALAVALADEVAATAGNHVALDSLFLDEGFGTLDNESLDVVARVIAELGAAGKTVGIVTHVEELAEQMPVRYEVRRSDNSATVTQVGMA